MPKAAFEKIGYSKKKFISLVKSMGNNAVEPRF